MNAIQRLKRQTTPLGERIESRGVIASALALGALTAAATGGAAVASGALQSRSADKAARLTTDAANKAAQLQAEANAAALKFQREQAARDEAQFKATQRANYDQWAARERRLGSLGQMIGLGDREIPPLPAYLQGGAPQSGLLSAMPSGDPSVSPDLLKIYNSVRAKSPAPTANSLDDLAAAFSAAGHKVDRPTYNGVKSGNELLVNGQKLKFTVGDVGSPSASWYTWGTNDSPMAGRGFAPSSLMGLATSNAPQSYVTTPALRAPDPYTLAGMIARR